MIRIVMLGRLGNNLFQYALGRVLAEKHGTQLVMDASWFNREGWSQVECLSRLPGPASGKSKIVRRFSIGARALRKIAGKHYWEYAGAPTLREDELDQSFDPRFLQAPADCLVFGYFQTPLYFEGMEEELRNELSTDGLGLEKGKESLAKKLRAPGSVAVHVRRTDYTGNPNLDLCGKRYYDLAMSRMRETFPDAHFHIFSDDPAWCQRQFTEADVSVVTDTNPNDSPLTDLHLMSLAHHHVIANSSYSWWAAWLGKKSGQKVLMPSRWFGTIIAPAEQKRCEDWEMISPAV